MDALVNDDEYGNFTLYLCFKTITFPLQPKRPILTTFPLQPLPFSLSVFSVKATEYATEWRNHYCMSSLSLLIKDDLAGHGLINFKDTKTKCLLYWCLIDLLLEIQSVMLVFSTQFCELLPLYLLSGSPPPPLPPSQIKSTDTDSVWLGRGGGCWVVLECWRTYSAEV